MEIELSTHKKVTVQWIYYDVFKKTNEQIIDIFLCGGASNSKYTSIRDLVKKDLSRNKYLRILYPEDLFIELLNKDKDYDLLSLEKFLANNCDAICIICESAGALVELGAFTNNDQTFSKVIAAIDEKRKKDKSFIMLGPVKLLSNNNKDHVIYYQKDNIQGLSDSLNSLFRKKRVYKKIKMRGKNEKGLNTIIGQFYFIPLLLYFFNSLKSKDLVSMLRYIYSREQVSFDKREFDTTFQSSIKLLYKDKMIIKKQVDPSPLYQLTDVGYKNVKNMLDNATIHNKNILYDKIRFSIMKDELY